MLSTQPIDELSETARLKRENIALRNRLSKLSEANLRMSESLDTDAVLQEVIESARAITGAQYGVLLTYSETGDVKSSFTSGMSSEQLGMIELSPKGYGLLGYLSELRWPLRLQDIASHPRSVGFPENHPPMKTFLGMPIYHSNVHVGNIFLTEKEGRQEFTSEDEEIITLFGSQAAAAIYNTRRYEQERQARNDLETIVNISPIGVMVIDARTADLTAINAEAMKIVGDLGATDTTFQKVSLEQFASQVTLCRADGTEIPLQGNPMARVLQSGETVRGEEIVVYRADGKSITTLVNAAPITSDDGDIASVVVVFQDLGPLEELERLRSEFLGLVSHELRTPLSTIKGSTSALLSIVNAMNQTEPLQLLRIIDQQADLMRAQINSLIELTHIEAGTLPVSLEPVEVAEVIDEASKEFWRGNLSTFTREIPEFLPRMMADRQRIAQVLKNLIYNVSKHSPQDSPIKVAATRDDVYVSISVSAEGGGVPYTEPGRLFQKFSRSNSDEIRQEIGADGLALAICKGIVEVHGGRIKAGPGPNGRGITFTFTVPAALEEEVRPTASPEFHLPGDVLPLTDKSRILLALKDSRTLSAIRRVLSRAGFATAATLDLSELDSLAADEKPHLLFLDLTSPTAKYFDLVERFSSVHGIPVLCLCKDGDEETVVRAFDLGADGYVTAPLSNTELVARIKASLRGRATFRKAEAPQGYLAGDLAIDYAGRIVSMSGQQVQLTATEYKLVFELSTSAGRILTQDELLQRVWGPEYSGESQLLRSYVKSLRHKLGDNARNPTYIFTEHGIGYRMVKA